MIYLSQRDPRWAGTRLGLSKLTVGRFGCTTTCISMLSDYFGCYKSPADLASQTDLYTIEGHSSGPGLIIWGKLSFPKMKFDIRIFGERRNTILRSLKDPKLACILQVNDGTHWVVALRPSLFGNDYLCLDPFTGRKCLAKKTYRNVTGSAHFSGKYQ